MAGEPQPGVHPHTPSLAPTGLLRHVGAWSTSSPWIPVGIGLVALYLPSYFTLAGTTWDTPENGHGPIMLAVVAWLFWQKRKLLRDAPVAPDLLSGWASLLTGLLCFVLGRSQGIATFEVASHLPVLTGVVLLMRGWSGLRTCWFPLLFLVFAIPLPGALVEAVTGVLKQEVSVVVEQLLYSAGYPVARNGVVLIVGQYQLLVADACSGLNSLFSLSALAMLYLYITGPASPRSRLHIVLMLLLALPVAFVANVIRVLLLVLITWYLGDEAGQGLAHGAAGLVLFITALGMILLADRALGLVLRAAPRRRSA